MSKCSDCCYFENDGLCTIRQWNFTQIKDMNSFCPDFQPKQPTQKIRQFDSGATRDTNIGKLDYEGFLSPIVLQRYAQYLHKHRTQSDGQLRNADNWQKGIPIVEYMKSKARHFINTWLIHRGTKLYDRGNLIDLEDSLCAELFNTMGYLFELLKKKSEEK